jgi:hypothetical protein
MKEKKNLLQAMARRHFKERPDIPGNLSNLELIERYRLDRDGMLNLNDELQVLSPSTNRNYSLSSLSQVLTTLWYLATGTIQLKNADMHFVSQPTVSRVIAKVTDALTSPDFCNRYINFPSTQLELNEVKQEFYGKTKFPKAAGVIDGTHIQIQAPTFEEAY